MAKAQPIALIAKDSTGAVTGTLSIDATVNETHTLAATITDHPVEEGFNVSDHSRPDPDKLQLECIISNTPLSRAQVARAVQTQGLAAAVTVLNPTQAAFSLSGSSVQARTTADAAAPIGDIEGRAQAAYRQLTDWKNTGQLLTVVTSLRPYESMGVEGVSIPRDAKNSDALHFTLSLKQVRVIESRVTRTRVPKDVRTATKKKTGAQTPKPVNDDDEDSPLYKVGTTGVDAAKKGAAYVKGLL